MARFLNIGTALGLTFVGAALAAACQPVATQPVTVQIDADEFSIKASQTTFRVGVPYHFVLRNSGKVAHEVMVMPMTASSAGMPMMEMDKLALGMVEEENFVAGATGSFDVTFTKAYGPGELEFACHVDRHYEDGMHQTITVTP